jgi:hypothetical protein
MEAAPSEGTLNYKFAHFPNMQTFGETGRVQWQLP